MMDVRFFDGAAWVAGVAYGLNWIMGNMTFLTSTVGLFVGVATFIYTVIRIVQAVKGK